MTATNTAKIADALCEECGESVSHSDHDRARWSQGLGDSHPFVAKDPKKGNPFQAVRKMTPAERAADPGPIGVSTKKTAKVTTVSAPTRAERPPCGICQKPAISHRGRGRGHKYDDPTKDKLTVRGAAKDSIQIITQIAPNEATRPIVTPRPTPRETKAPKRETKPRPTSPKVSELVDRALQLAADIRDLEWRMTAKRDELAELLA